MDEKKLLAAIEEQETLAEARALATERQSALDRYLGEPYGNEVEGRSKIVMRDVADTIEWIKPALMKIFASGDEVCVFNPVGPEDVDQAEQETEYINHVLMQKNDGFVILHDWFHDALLQKNGYVLVRPVIESRLQSSQYEGLTEDEFTLLMQTEGLECTAHSEFVDAMGVARHSCSVRRMVDKRMVRVVNIPPERVRVASDWPGVNLDGCPFVEVIEYLTVSQLREMGFEIDDNISDASTSSDEWEESNRHQNDEFLGRSDIEADASTRRLKTRCIWMLYDMDGDGIAELNYLVVVGTTILHNSPDDLTPVACITPSRMPHEHVGQSIDDAVQDLQAIRTTLVRGFLDNMYLANNGRNAIDASRVNLDDMLTSRPGGVVRVSGDPSGAIVPLVHPQVGGDILQAVEYVDSVRENRTGVTRYNQGIDANSLNKTATGINAIQNASMQRIELIARMFAETGVKQLMLILHAVSVKHGRQQEMIRLRGKWVPVSPYEWQERKDMTVSVGIGTGNKDQQLMHLTTIWQMQLAGLQLGITKPANLYHTASKMTQNAGFKQHELFWSDPAQQQQGPQQPPPEVQAEQMKQQADVQKFQAQTQIDRMKAEQEAQMRMQEAALKAQQDEQALQAKLAFDQWMASEKMNFEKWKTEQDNTVKLTIAQMSHEATLSGQAHAIEGRAMGIAESEVSPIRQQLIEVAQGLQAMQAQMMAPRKIVRGPDGKAIGVDVGGVVKSINRGADGRIEGVL